MTTQSMPETTSPPNPWALGDYHRFAKATVWEVGAVLVEACGVAAGQQVLDVAAGTGNVAIRAAQLGARVVASDVTPQNFAAGRREAAEQGVELEWVEADAQALPFDDDAFDVVTSAFGVMFAPDHRAAAGELVRVCRPGGVIGLASFTPEGLGGEFFDLFARYSPPPPAGALPPILWGSEAHGRDLLAEQATLQLERRQYTERAPSSRAYRDLFKESFGPAVAIYASLAAEPDRQAEFDQALLDYALRNNSAASEGPAEYRYEYLLLVGRVGAGGGR